MKRISLAVSILGVSVLLSACAGKTHQSSQAAATDKSPAEVHQMPSGFRNFSDKCDGFGHRVYVTSDSGESQTSSGITVIADPSCPSAGR